MQRISFFIIALVVATGARGAILPLYEPFDYAPGTALGGQTPDAGGHVWAVAGTGTIDEPTAASGSLSMPAGMPAGTGNSVIYGGTGKTDRINIVDAGSPGLTAGTVYYSMPFTVTNTGTVTGQTGAIGQIISGFNNTVGNQNPNPTAHGADIWIQPGPTTPGTFRIGFSLTPVTTTRTFHTEEFDLGETVFVVASYEFIAGANNDIARLWINPTGLGGDTPPEPTLTVMGVSGVADLTDAESFLLYQTSTATANTLGEGGVRVDEIRVADTWAGVTPIPEPSLSLLTLAAAALVLSRRRPGPFFA